MTIRLHLGSLNLPDKESFATTKPQPPHPLLGCDAIPVEKPWVQTVDSNDYFLLENHW